MRANKEKERFECPICYRDFHPDQDDWVCCLRCGTNTCKECVKTQSQTTQNAVPTCVGCKLPHLWSSIEKPFLAHLFLPSHEYLVDNNAVQSVDTLRFLKSVYEQETLSAEEKKAGGLYHILRRIDQSIKQTIQLEKKVNAISIEVQQAVYAVPYSEAGLRLSSASEKHSRLRGLKQDPPSYDQDIFTIHYGDAFFASCTLALPESRCNIAFEIKKKLSKISDAANFAGIETRNRRRDLDNLLKTVLVMICERLKNSPELMKPSRPLLANPNETGPETRPSFRHYFKFLPLSRFEDAIKVLEIEYLQAMREMQVEFPVVVEKLGNPPPITDQEKRKLESIRDKLIDTLERESCDYEANAEQNEDDIKDLGIVKGRHCAFPDCGGLLSTRNLVDERSLFSHNPSGVLCCATCCRWQCERCWSILSSRLEAHPLDCGDSATEEQAEIFTVNAVKKCPDCLTPIARGEGCPDMFCTVCGCKFDHNTLKVVDKSAHNPVESDLRAYRAMNLTSDHQVYVRLASVYSPADPLADPRVLSACYFRLFQDLHQLRNRFVTPNRDEKKVISPFHDIATNLAFKLINYGIDNIFSLSCLSLTDYRADTAESALRLSYAVGQIDRTTFATSLFRSRILKEEGLVASMHLLTFYKIVLSELHSAEADAAAANTLLKKAEINSRFVDVAENCRFAFNRAMIRDLSHIRPVVLTNEFYLCAWPMVEDHHVSGMISHTMQHPLVKSSPAALSFCIDLASHQLHTNVNYSASRFRSRDRWMFGDRMETPKIVAFHLAGEASHFLISSVLTSKMKTRHDDRVRDMMEKLKRKREAQDLESNKKTRMAPQ